jgi:hypothetical protein
MFNPERTTPDVGHILTSLQREQLLRALIHYPELTVEQIIAILESVHLVKQP